MAVNAETYKAAVELAAPSLAGEKLLYSQTNQALVVRILENAYNAIAAAHAEINQGK